MDDPNLTEHPLAGGGTFRHAAAAYVRQHQPLWAAALRVSCID